MSKLQVAEIENLVPGNTVKISAPIVQAGSSVGGLNHTTVQADSTTPDSKVYSLRLNRFSSDPSGYAAEIGFLRGSNVADGAITLHTNVGPVPALTSLPERMRVKPSGEIEIGSGGDTVSGSRVSITQSTSNFALELKNASRSYAFRLDPGNSLVLSDRTSSIDRLSLTPAGVFLLSGDIDVAGAADFAGGATALPPGSASDSSTRVATTSWVDSTFNGSGRALKSANGYQRLPGANGLIIQWGTTPSVPADSILSVAFPIAFPNAAFSVVGNASTSVISGGSAQTGVAFTSVTTTGFDVANDTTATPVRWIAVGY